MTKEMRIVEYYKANEEEFVDTIEQLDAWNGYLGDNRYYYIDEFDELMDGLKPSEIVREIHFGDFNPCDDYFRFDAYGNLESDYKKDYSCYLDEHFAEAVIENANRLDLPDGVQEILDEEDDDAEE